MQTRFLKPRLIPGKGIVAPFLYGYIIRGENREMSPDTDAMGKEEKKSRVRTHPGATSPPASLLLCESHCEWSDRLPSLCQMSVQSPCCPFMPLHIEAAAGAAPPCKYMSGDVWCVKSCLRHLEPPVAALRAYPRPLFWVFFWGGAAWLHGKSTGLPQASYKNFMQDLLRSSVPDPVSISSVCLCVSNSLLVS